MSEKSREPRVIVEGGEPTAVILDIEEYRELLARLEDHEDLRRLDEIRREGTRYRPLSEYRSERLGAVRRLSELNPPVPDPEEMKRESAIDGG